MDLGEKNNKDIWYSIARTILKICAQDEKC